MAGALINSSLGSETKTPTPVTEVQPGQYNIYDHIETLPGGREKLMEEISAGFACNPVRSEHDRYANHFVPWHWHQELELFFCEQGEVVYEVPRETATVRAGDAGLVNANVLHSTHATGSDAPANLKIHMFRTAFIAEPGSRIYRSYVEPLVTATSVGLLVARSAPHPKTSPWEEGRVAAIPRGAASPRTPRTWARRHAQGPRRSRAHAPRR